jgi:5-formyltetrahydrofolate cyclo-ligase
MELEARRRALTPQDVELRSGEVLRNLAALPFLATAKLVALYSAQAFEVQTAGLIALVGARAVFPRVISKGMPLALHRVAHVGDLVPGVLGLLEPRSDTPTVTADEIDAWVVPGVGFTRDGKRLGRGAGYYDRTLALARADAPKVGVCFADCLVDDLPTDVWDAPMDWVVTDRESVRVQKA